VLSDPKKRRDYDAGLSARGAARRAPAPPRRQRVEPLVPEPLSGPGPWVEELFAPRAAVVEGPWPRHGPYELLLWLRRRGGG